MRRFTLVPIIATVAFLVVVTAFLFPFLAPGHDNIDQITCPHNLKDISTAAIEYSQDYDARRLLTRGNGHKNDRGYGWAGSIQPYLKSVLDLHCPFVRSGHSEITGQSGFSDYYYNALLSGMNANMLQYPASTLAFADGNDGIDFSDAAYGKTHLPIRWTTDPGEPTFRHKGGANYAFADGHVKWLAPTAITDAKASSSVVTFAVK